MYYFADTLDYNTHLFRVIVCYKLTTLHCCDRHAMQERREHKQKFLDRDVERMTIDGAMSALLEVGGQQFKNNVELYGAVHTDELR